MPLTIGIAGEIAADEKRVAIVPEVAKKLGDLKVDVAIERLAGLASHYKDSDYPAHVGWKHSAVEVFAASQLIWTVQPPSAERITQLPRGTIVAGLLQPYADRERLEQLCAQGITSLAMELVPRISRAQTMDALSSQAACAGYQCALIAAARSTKFFPMLTTAAGTIRPARVFVIGAGVAGLQAIATARRLGAIVEAYDVRAAAREQIESLGAKFLDTGVTAEGSGGYARELTVEEKAAQQEKLAKALATADCIITTAAIPGKKAPVIVTRDMVARMKFGAIVVDMAAESGGNCELTVPGEHVVANDVHIHGPLNLPSRMPTHASEMYAKNLFNLFSPFIKDGELKLDFEDEVIAGCLLTHEGKVVHENVRKVLDL
ncbi:MAG TPA: NAD(P) transhydrogenase subunit alpha [Rhodocyclaceae bacterium]